MAKIDLSFAKAAQLLLPVHGGFRFLLVGCGGTGSWLAPSIARIAKVLQEKNVDVETVFCDPDQVEAKNIPRQNFCQAELGRNKALTLAARYSAAWGIEINAVPYRFSPEVFRNIGFQKVNLIIGCVDNAAARRQIHKVIAEADHGEYFWLDCGNAESSGQVLLGSATAAKELQGAFRSRKICTALPAPSLVARDLLVDRPEELLAAKLSCADIQLANDQSLAVNQMVASIATDYLLRFCFGGLRRFATYFDLEAGSMRSRYITPDEIAGLIRKPVAFLTDAKEKRKAA